MDNLRKAVAWVLGEAFMSSVDVDNRDDLGRSYPHLVRCYDQIMESAYDEDTESPTPH